MTARDTERLWRCPSCHHENKRHHAQTERPFCDNCDGLGVLVEMKPIGKGAEKFYDEDGFSVNP
ncbi:hypothetical protein [Halomarina oriensis]|uniref:Uncharacterized protein n=1 Tax=Halomarina oriensis TaxID=671145 RepID=A0A6B0GS50_9EURY|nr:hypothetical protein [Halomarina oriensis]MWG36509.1 hypothetical protein [Halomarina oriensis]